MQNNHIPLLTRSLPACLAAVLGLAASAQASSRHFAYNYETTTMPAGSFELENTATWEKGIEGNSDVGRFDIRHELEYGFTDRLQVSFYFADWSYTKPVNESGKAKFEDVAMEAIYNLTDPNTSPVGSALYGEITAGDHLFGLESKLLLQKNIGRWLLVYNVGGEIRWEGDGYEDEGELSQSAGIAYQINPSWTAGAEILHEIALPDLSSIGHSGVYLGPDASWRKGNITLTFAGLWQLTSLHTEPDFQLRAILSLQF